MTAVVFFSAPAHANPDLKAASFTLDNGLQVVVVEEHRAPIVTHMLWFRAGAADDPRGASGIAHYLEHMMFKATKKLKEGEYIATIERLGGQHNASTSRDFTAYYVTIAKEHLPKVMQLETERVRHLSPSEENFLSERSVIVEERNMRTDNSPESQLQEAMTAALFRNHPYRISPIGWKHEIEQLTRDDVMEFYRTWYHPGNALLLLVGDITPAEAKALAAKYYKPWKSAVTPPRHWPTEPPQIAGQTLTSRDGRVTQPQWKRMYMAPSLVSGDTARVFPLIVLSQVLGGGKTGLLYQRLVQERKVAAAAQTGYDAFALGPGAFYVEMIPAESADFPTLEKAYTEEMARFIADGVSAEDLIRAKNKLKAETIYARDGIEKTAFILGELLILGYDEQFFNDWPEKIDAVTLEQLQNAARAVLDDRLATTGHLLPEEKGAADAH